MTQRIARGWFTEAGKLVPPGMLEQLNTTMPLAATKTETHPKESTSAQSKKHSEIEVPDNEAAATHILQTANVTQITRMRKAVLVAICSLKLAKGGGASDDFNKSTVPDLRSKIKAWVSC
jgi:hypothetical protein